MILLLIEINQSVDDHFFKDVYVVIIHIKYIFSNINIIFLVTQICGSGDIQTPNSQLIRDNLIFLTFPPEAFI